MRKHLPIGLITIAIFILASLIMFITPTAVAAPVLQMAHCPDGDEWTKVEKSGPWDYTASGGNIIIAVCIKSSNGAMIFHSNGTTSDGCYVISGIGTGSASAADVSDAPSECHEISYASFNKVPPTSEPPLTETPELTLTDTPEPTLTETPGPSPTPTETPTEPTTTPTYCHTPTPTNTDTPRKTPTLPYTGNVLFEMRSFLEAGSYLMIPEIGLNTSIWLAPYTEYMGWDIAGIGNKPTLLDGTHAIAGHLNGLFYDLYLLEPGDYIFLNGIPYVMREERFVSPFDMDVLAEGDLVLFTCSWWTGSTYRFRRVIIADSLTQ